jgi:hypothetical protein
MPGVRSPECAGLITRMFHPGARKRPNSGMHPTADTTAVIYLPRGRAAGDASVRRSATIADNNKLVDSHIQNNYCIRDFAPQLTGLSSCLNLQILVI